MRDFKISIEYNSDYDELVIRDENTGTEMIENEVGIIDDILDSVEEMLNEVASE